MKSAKKKGASNNPRSPDVHGRLERFVDGCRETLGRVVVSIGLFFAMVALPILAQAGWEYLTLSPVFALKQVEVEGNKGLSTEEIKSIAKAHSGQNLIDTDVTAIRKEILATGWVRDVEITRELPDTLRVIVQEYVPAATLLAGGLSMIDENGKIFRTVLPGERVPRPVISGIPNPDDPQQARMLERALAISGLYRKAGLLEFDQLAEITHNHVRGFSITTEAYRVVAHLGHKNHRRSIRQLRFAVHDAIDRGLGVPLEVHADLGPDRIVILPSKKPRSLPSNIAWRADASTPGNLPVEERGVEGRRKKRHAQASKTASKTNHPSVE